VDVACSTLTCSPVLHRRRREEDCWHHLDYVNGLGKREVDGEGGGVHTRVMQHLDLIADLGCPGVHATCAHFPQVGVVFYHSHQHREGGCGISRRRWYMTKNEVQQGSHAVLLLGLLPQRRQRFRRPSLCPNHHDKINASRGNNRDAVRCEDAEREGTMHGYTVKYPISERSPSPINVVASLDSSLTGTRLSSTQTCRARTLSLIGILR
jgi:hypothetical protein